MAWAGPAGAGSHSPPPAAGTASGASAPSGARALRTWAGAHRREIRRPGVAVSAKAFGVTPRTLVAEWRAGTPIAGVAAQHGLSAQTVVPHLVKAADTRIDRAVSLHKLSATRAPRIEAALPGYASAAVNHAVKYNHAVK